MPKDLRTQTHLYHNSLFFLRVRAAACRDILLAERCSAAKTGVLSPAKQKCEVLSFLDNGQQRVTLPLRSFTTTVWAQSVSGLSFATLVTCSTSSTKSSSSADLATWIAVLCLVACAAGGSVREKRGFLGGLHSVGGGYSGYGGVSALGGISDIGGYSAPAAQVVSVNKVVNVPRVVSVPQVVRVNKVVFRAPSCVC
ncbi:unnamed protein product [Parnassius apollo]|uniref:(apollo) hypothetical protein n=1 Tax=Parnassius apollo TaxID=110799 RepID=A0A8S3VYX6_PARAO|nr:unnamed protein product [Parnassius apollo]